MLINLIQIDRRMAGVLRLAVGLLSGFSQTGAAKNMTVLTTSQGIKALEDFGCRTEDFRFQTVPSVLGRSKLAVAVSSLFVVPILAVRHRAVAVLNLDYYFSPAPRATRSFSFITDLQFLERPSSFPRAARWSRRFFIGLGARYADGLFVISEATGRQLVERFCRATGKTHVVHLGIDSMQAGTKERLAEHLLFVGTTNRHKNLETLLEALCHSRLSTHTLTIAGRPGSFEADLLSLIDRKRLHDRVQRVGRIDETELGDLYRSASALVAPSRFEGFDLPALEAMAVGAPVVASNIPVHKEVLGPHACFFEVDDADSLVDAILRSESRSDSVHSAAAHHAQTFTWARSAQSTLDHVA